MIRSADLIFDPNRKFIDKPISPQEIEPEWKRSLRYLDDLGFSLHYISKGCSLVDKVAHLAPLNPIAASIDQLVKPLGRISQIANLVISAEAFSVLSREGKLGLNLSSANEVIILAGKGIEIASWLSEVEKLGFSLRVISSLSSTSLVLGLVSPMLSFLVHLREEGWSAFSGIEGYKVSYELGMALLTIYLFTTTVTLSAHLEALIMSTNFALSFL